MLTKLVVFATLALSAAQAQNASATTSAAGAAPSSGFKFTETFPASGSIPTPKPEWLELIANVNITNAPVLKGGSDGPAATGSDEFCDWTFTGCTRPTDITTCPKGQWGITYDDGPTQFSPALYDFLDKSNQKATFFLIGGQVVQYPDYVKRIFDAGHELAMHTWSHSYMTTLTNEQIVAELKWNELAIKQVTGYSPRFFRPPYGDIDDRVRDVVKALGFTPVIWDHDTDDWMAGESTSFQVEWIDNNATEWAAAAQNSTTGGISLEHDLYQVTVDAAIRVLPILQGAYNVTTVGACTGQPSYKEGAPVNQTTSAIPSASASPTGVATPSDHDTQTEGQLHGTGSQLVAMSSTGLVLVAAAAYLLI